MQRGPDFLSDSGASSVLLAMRLKICLRPRFRKSAITGWLRRLCRCESMESAAHVFHCPLVRFRCQGLLRNYFVWLLIHGSIPSPLILHPFRRDALHVSCRRTNLVAAWMILVIPEVAMWALFSRKTLPGDFAQVLPESCNLVTLMRFELMYSA